MYNLYPLILLVDDTTSVSMLLYKYIGLQFRKSESSDLFSKYYVNYTHRISYLVETSKSMSLLND